MFYIITQSNAHSITKVLYTDIYFFVNARYYFIRLYDTYTVCTFGNCHSMLAFSCFLDSQEQDLTHAFIPSGQSSCTYSCQRNNAVSRGKTGYCRTGKRVGYAYYTDSTPSASLPCYRVRELSCAVSFQPAAGLDNRVQQSLYH